MAQVFDLGDSVQLTFLVKDANGNPINATVSIVVTKPDNTPVSPAPSISNPVTGTYTAVVAPDQTGMYVYKWTAVGAAVTAEDGSFFVDANLTARAYTTRGELKSWLKIPVTNSDSDDELDRAAIAATQSIDDECERHFWQVTEARSFVVWDDYRLLRLGRFNDLVSATAVKSDLDFDGVYETVWAATDYRLERYTGTANINAASQQRPYTQFRAVGQLLLPINPYGEGYGRQDLLQITGTWGWPAVPPKIRQACLLVATDIFKRREAPFGIAGNTEFGVVRVREDPKVMKLIGRYRYSAGVFA